jgi:hypothetical protein
MSIELMLKGIEFRPTYIDKANIIAFNQNSDYTTVICTYQAGNPKLLYKIEVKQTEAEIIALCNKV